MYKYLFMISVLLFVSCDTWLYLNFVPNIMFMLPVMLTLECEQIVGKFLNEQNSNDTNCFSLLKSQVQNASKEKMLVQP
jgi:hypothetical protein